MFWFYIPPRLPEYKQNARRCLIITSISARAPGTPQPLQFYSPSSSVPICACSKLLFKCLFEHAPANSKHIDVAHALWTAKNAVFEMRCWVKREGTLNGASDPRSEYTLEVQFSQVGWTSFSWIYKLLLGWEVLFANRALNSTTVQINFPPLGSANAGPSSSTGTPSFAVVGWINGRYNPHYFFARVFK